MKITPLWLGIGAGVLALLSLSIGWYLNSLYRLEIQNTGVSQDLNQGQEPTVEQPLLSYTISALRDKVVGEAILSVNETPLHIADTYLQYTYSAQTLNKKMSGVITTPIKVEPTTPVIIMLRGYVPPSSYLPGMGTNPAARKYAENGFITIAPDFFGVAESDPEAVDVWQGRFEKPLIVIELLHTLRNSGLPLPSGKINPSGIGLWGHSNGGQIALTTLTILQESIPTTLWAPVTAPFPYNILYFSDEEEDEGKDTRKWISLFEETYDAREFSFTNYLDGIRGPLLIHQGTNDDAVLQWWSTEFAEKLDTENLRRKALLNEIKNLPVDTVESNNTLTDESASASSTNSINAVSDGHNRSRNTFVNESEDLLLKYNSIPPDQQRIDTISYELHLYPGANHNLTPGWDTVVLRDINFFKSSL